MAGIFQLINRYLNTKDASIKGQLQKLEKDSVRLQILLLIHDYPNDRTEILECAQHYFADLHGDWYLTPVFNKWLIDQHVGQPDWFIPEK